MSDTQSIKIQKIIQTSGAQDNTNFFFFLQFSQIDQILFLIQLSFGLYMVLPIATT